MKSIYFAGPFLILVFLVIFCHSKDTRKLHVIYNPNCNISACDSNDNYSNENFNNLVYVRADGTNDTIHYLWSSVGSFSILMAYTDLDSELIVNWETLLSDDMSGAISFSNVPFYSSVIVFTNLWEYYDKDNKNDISLVPDDHIIQHQFNQFGWYEASAVNVSDDEATASFLVHNSEVGNRTINITLSAYGYKGHAKKLPRLLHTAESFQLEFIMDNITTTFNKTRFVLEVIELSSDDSGDFKLKHYRSIDDEYTPGVFKTVELTSPLSQKKDWGSFLQWKPVCYTDRKSLTTESSTEVNEVLGALLLENRTLEIGKSLAAAYYASDIETALFTSLNISYGLQGDKFYQDSDYMSWTVSMGLGVPPSESFSTLVIIVIVVGFGVPALLIIIGSVYILIRRCKSKDDDLIMSSTKLFSDVDS